MTEKPLVSVIINCYNGEKYLREAIDSVMAQTYENWELVFWDNQSTDSTREIVESYKNPKIKYYFAPNHTPLGEARNLAMREAKGQYISFLDADDLWLSVFLETGLKILASNNEIIGYYCNYFDLFPKQETIHSSFVISPIRKAADIVSYYNIGMSGVILKANIIRNNNLFFNEDYNLIEDLDFYFRVTVVGPLYYDAKPLIKYRCHFGSTTYRRAKEWAGEYDLFLSKLRREYMEQGVIEEKDLWRIKLSAFGAHMERFIQENDKWNFLKLFFGNIKYLKYYWRNFLFIIVGKNVFLKIRNKKKFIVP